MKARLYTGRHTGPILVRDHKDRAIVQEMRFYVPLRLTGAYVLDIGAHIGAFVQMAVCRGAASIVAIEPDAQNFRLLQANSGRGGTSPIKLLHGAVVPGDYQEGHVDLWIARSAWGHSTVKIRGRGKAQRVPAFHLAGLLRNVTVLKCDIEGAEYDLMDELMALPSSVQQVAIETHYGRQAWREGAQTLVTGLRAQGFRAVTPPVNVNGGARAQVHVMVRS